MAYTAATDLPNLNFAQWSQPTSANPRLATPISATDTTIVVTSAPKDHTDTVITGNFLMGIKNSAGYTETIYVPVGSSSDGITFTSVIRGVWLEGLDYTTSDTTSKAVAFDQDSPVYFNVSPVIEKLVFAALLGTIGSTYKLNARPTYSGTNAVHGERIFADTTARDAAITAPQNGDTCYVTADGVFYDYQGGAWADRASGSTPNASPTVAGKVEIATQAQNDAGTVTGETGALLAATPDLNAKSVQDAKWVYAASSGGTDTYAITVAPAPAAYAAGQTFRFFADVANTGAATLNVSGLGAKNINKLCAGAAATLENNDIIAGFVYSVTYNGTYFVLDNPVANTMTSANKATLTGGSSSDANSLHTHTKTKNGTFTVSAGASSGTATCTHNLGINPKAILLFATGYNANATFQWSNGSVDDDMTNSCSFSTGYDNSSTQDVDTSNSIRVLDGTTASDGYTGQVTSWSTSTFTVSYSKQGTGATGLSVHWIAIT